MKNYWTDRTGKPNLERGEFEKIIEALSDDEPADRWENRASLNGPHGHDGEDQVLYLTIKRYSFGKVREYLVKDYFFTKTRCIGVTIQTCREVSGSNLYHLRT